MNEEVKAQIRERLRERIEATMLEVYEAGKAAYIGQLELDLAIGKSAHQDDLRHIEVLKDDLREIYRLRGEDPEISRICNRALSA